jgi:hypothetical protein
VLKDRAAVFIHDTPMDLPGLLKNLLECSRACQECSCPVW